MYIGNILKERMDMFKMSIDKLSEESLVDKEVLEDILNNKLSLKEIDEFDLDFISQVLYCTTEYFSDDKVRENDLVYTSYKKGNRNLKCLSTMGKIIRLAEDFEFINGLYKQVT